jgi:hypothetical protein
LHSRRRKAFLALKSKGEVTEDECPTWLAKRKRTGALLNFFNTKHTPVAERRLATRTCLRDRKRAASELRDQKEKQIERGLETHEATNSDDRRKHEARCMTFEKWGKVHRFTSMGGLEEHLVGVDPMHPGKEFSHASKTGIVRRQMQLRKQCDGIRKAGDVSLSDRAGKGDPDAEGGLLDLLLSDFRAMLQQEAAQGVPEPKKTFARKTPCTRRRVDGPGKAAARKAARESSGTHQGLSRPAPRRGVCCIQNGANQGPRSEAARWCEV